MKKLPVTLVALLALSVPVAASGITASEHDDFEEGGESWAGGASNTVPADGGPDGAGDAYYRIVASGTGGNGGKVVVRNIVQWTGDYNAVSPVVAIALDVQNFCATPLTLRVGLSDASSGGGPQGNAFVTADGAAVAVPGSSGWVRAVTFELRETDLTQLNGAGSLETALDAIAELRILSAATESWFGDEIACQVGLDNIRVVSLFADGFESGDTLAWD